LNTDFQGGFNLNSGATMKLANFIYKLNYSELPSNTINRAKESLLDYFV